MSARCTGFRPEPEELTRRHHSFDLIRARVRRAASDRGDASDLRPYSAARQDQQKTESCIAQAIAKAAEVKRVVQVVEESLASGFMASDALAAGLAAHVDLSRLALYYLMRELLDPPETAYDAGGYVSVGADVLRRFGVCEESVWPFQEEDGSALDGGRTDSRLFRSPPWSVMRRAYVHKVTAFHAITTTGPDRVEDVILSLRAENPVVYGARIGDAWDHYDGTSVLGPEKDTTGGHATVLLGWDPDLLGGVFIGESSWGTSWGDGGFYLLSPDVVSSSQASDFVVIAGGWESWS